MGFMLVSFAGRMIIGFATLVVVAAVMFFVVKPAVESATESTNRAFDNAQRQSQQIQEDVQENDTTRDAFQQSEQIQEEGLKAAEQAQKRAACLAGAAGDPDKVAKC